MDQFEALVAQCDENIRGGRPQEVARRLARLKNMRIPRQWRLPLAKICRRAGLYSTGLSLLSRLVHSRKAAACATPNELAEYAVLLLRSGAVNEALKRLMAINAQHVTDALLFRAFAYFSLWQFREAIPYLEEYLSTALSPQATLVGRTNLAFALVESRQQKAALKTLAENLELAQRQGHRHLERHNHALRAQVYIQEGNLDLARQELAIARQEDSLNQTHDQFFVTKLAMIVEALESKSVLPLATLRRLAIEKRDWFTLRDADLFSLKINFDEKRFQHLYFGSPMPGFRQCIAHELGRTPDCQSYLLGPESAPRFDLLTGQLNGVEIINVGGKCHRLIDVLLRDLYQPLRVAGLFSELFPDEQFDVETSPDRVRQVIRRTRQWLSDQNIPAAIKEDNGFYALEFRGPFAVQLPLERPMIDHFSLHFKNLSKNFGPHRWFSCKEACEVLNLSMTSVHRILKQAIETGCIERLGSIKRPRGYRLVTAADPYKAAA